MVENFGARLRQRRLEQGISLNAIAQQTKIKLSLLEGLERDDVSRWPSGIFRRAYIRTYAQAIGLDPDVVLREFLEVHAEPAEVFTAALETALAADRARANTSAPSRLRDIVGSALGSLSLFRRSPATDRPASHAEDHLATDDVFEEEHEADAAVVYASPGLAWADTADDAGVELPMLEGPETMAYEEVHRVVAPPAALANVMDASKEVAAADPSAAREVVGVAEQVESAESATRDPRSTTAYPNLPALARWCTDFGRMDDPEDLAILLEDAARLVEATGLIVWMWDESVDGLRPALAHGYSGRVLAHLPTVARDADNATAAAFRSAEICRINSSDHVSGALVVPLMTQTGCAGVLAIELQPGVEHTDAISAVATIIAALLAQLVARTCAAEVEVQSEMPAPAVENMPSPVVRTRFAY